MLGDVVGAIVVGLLLVAVVADIIHFSFFAERCPRCRSKIWFHKHESHERCDRCLLWETRGPRR